MKRRTYKMLWNTVGEGISEAEGGICEELTRKNFVGHPQTTGLDTVLEGYRRFSRQ